MTIYLKTFAFLVLISFSFEGQSAKEKLIGTIYKMDSHKKDVLFKMYRNFSKGATGIKVKTVYKNATGGIALEQDMKYDKRGNFSSLTLEQKQINTKGKIEIKEGMVIFHYKKQNGGNKISREKKTDNFIVGPTMVPYLQKHWQKILSGKSVKTRFGVMSRRETVGFTYKKIKEGKLNGEPVITVKMSGSSWLISKLVDPLYFTFRKKDKQLLYQKGRVIPKIKKDGSWENLDAETYYIP